MPKHFTILIALLAVLTVIPTATGEMTSTNYKIPTAVMSGGGAPMISASHAANGTLGQSSPLMEPGDPPFSDSYDLYPGFWYTVTAGGCPGDYDGDGDVDGLDLYDYIWDYPGDVPWPLETFAENFGRNDCLLPP